MRLSAATYYADYIVHPAGAVALMVTAMATTPIEEWGL